jgi:peptidoglycan hydrolase-like protein with peptidoglycan-binding domain
VTLMGDEPELGLGDFGEHVVQLQDRLRGLGLFDRFPDGSYDDATEAAVRRFQSDLGLDADGRVTAQTWQTIDDRMQQYGLTYDPYAGAGNQHWDQPAAPEPPAEAEPAPAVIPHPDDIHPAVANDERFASFHQFLRDTHGV